MNSVTIPPSPNWYFPDILACAPDGTLVYGSHMSIVVIKPRPVDQPADIKLIPFAHHERIATVSLNSKWGEGNRFMASAGEDKAVKVWNCDSLELFKSHNSHSTNESKLIGATYAGSDKVVSVSEDGMIVVWKVSTNELNPITNLFKGKTQVTCLASCPHAPWLCAFGLRNGLVIIADLRLSGQVKYKLKGHEKNITDLTWCPVPVNIFPKLKTKQITLKDRLQKIYDEAKVENTPPLDGGDSNGVKPADIENNSPLVSADSNAIKPTGSMSIKEENESKKPTESMGSTSKNVIQTEIKKPTESACSLIKDQEEESQELQKVLEKNKENTLKSSGYNFKKSNPWMNLKHADDDEIQEEEKPAPPEESDFLKECLSLREKIVSVAESDDVEEECQETPVKKEVKPRKILKARKPKKSENYAAASNIEEDLFSCKSEEDLVTNKQVDDDQGGNAGVSGTGNIAVSSKSDVDLNKSIDELLEETGKFKSSLEKVTDNLKKMTVGSNIDKGIKAQVAEDLIANEEDEFIAEESRKEFLLASVSSNGTIIIWRAGTDGKVQTKLSIANKNKSRNPRAKDKIWMSAFWMSPTTLLSSGGNGELLLWDLKNYSNGTLKSRTVHGDHQSVLFSIAAPAQSIAPASSDNGNWREQPKLDTLSAWTVGQERMLLNTTIDLQRKTVACYPTLGNSVQFLAASPIDPNKLAIGTADGFIKIWDLSRPHLQYITMTMFKMKPQSKVLNLAWHPEQEGVLAYGTEEGHVGIINPSCSSKPPTLLIHYFRSSIHKLEWGPMKSKEHDGLYSCSEGVLVLYDIKNPLESPTVIQTPDGKYITQFSWKQDNSALALGTKDGTIILFTQDLEYQTTLFYQQKSIVTLFWHPQATAEDEEISPYESWLASSSSDGAVVVYDMKNINEDVDLPNRVVAEQKEHTKFIRAMSWSPHEGGKLLSASEDGSAHIWDVKNKVILSSYLNPFCQPVTACTWSPLDKNYAILAGRQCILQIININDYTPIAREEVQRELNKRKKKLGSKAVKEELKNEDAPVVKKSVHSKDLLLSSVTNLQRDKDSLLKDCQQLMALNEGSSDVDRSKSQVLQLFGNQEDVHKMLQQQQDQHTSKSKHSLSQHLSLWKGDIGESIKKAITEGQLTPWLISMAPMVSPILWQEACESYADQLVEDPNGDGVQAASYYLSCHKVEKAIDALCSKKRFKEALALAKCRLPSEKSVIDKIILDWATYYIINGSYEVSAQCYIALEKYEEAAKALYKRSDLEILSLAVELAEKSKNTEMINTVKFRYDSFKTQNESEDLEAELPTRIEAVLVKEGDDAELATKIEALLIKVDTDEVNQGNT